MLRKTKVLFFIGRFFLGLVFVYSGFTKLMEPVETFQGAIANYEIVPYVFVPYIAQIFPWVEFIFGSFLIVGYLPRFSAIMLGGMSASFVTLIVLTKIKTGSLPADCGCFGEGSFIHLKPWQTLVLDILNTALGLMLAFHKNHLLSLSKFLAAKTESR